MPGSAGLRGTVKLCSRYRVRLESLHRNPLRQVGNQEATSAALSSRRCRRFEQGGVRATLRRW